MEANFARMCRACMGEGDGGDAPMLPIFPDENEEGASAPLCDMLMAVAQVRIARDDGLPRQLCAECAHSLDAALAFRRLAEKSDALLHAVVKREEPHHVAASQHDYDDDFFMFKVEPETQLCEGEKDEEEEEEEVAVAVASSSTMHSCSLCGKLYSNAKSLRRHAAAHGGEAVPCDRCEKTFLRKDHLRKHLTNVHAVDDVDEAMSRICPPNQTKHSCRRCGVDAPTKAQLVKHARACHGGEDDDDDEDDDSDDDEERRGGAVATIKEERGDGDAEPRLYLSVVYTCAVCDVAYDNQHSYAAHMTKHSEPLPKGQTHFACTECPKAFAKRKNLKQHLLTHNREKTNKCTLCSRAFTRPDQLILHMNNHTGKKRHQCPHCDKGFNMLSTLKDHLRTHNGEKPYLCSICGKSFSQNTNLKQHLMRHSAIKPYGCPTCRSTFVSKGELDAHVRKHTGEHPFVCDTCGVGFTTSSSLVKHRRIHSGERPYACDLCPLRFTALGTLKNHRRTHTGEKPFECTHCGRAFTQKSDMVSHVRTHTGERPYVCAICGAPYQQSSALKAHVKSHHPQVKKEPPSLVVVVPLSTE